MSVSPIQLKFVIPVSGHQIVFYLGLNASVTIDWGDATTTTTSTSQNNSHTYSAAGTYNVTVTGGTTTSVYKFGIGSNLIMSPYLTEINSWGGFSLTSLETMLSRFAGTLTTIPALPSTVTILDYAFYDVSGTIPDITEWDTTNVTSMLSMFHASNFNQNISDWNTGNVTNMYRMFGDTTQFNQPIGSWNVSKVTIATYMFTSAKKFNQPVNNWRFAPNCNFTGMFASSTLFNQSVVGWDICGNNVNNMFQNAIAFNQNLGALNISKVSSLSGFFNGAGMSEANINSTLQGWAAQTVRSNVVLDASGLYYSGDGYTAAAQLRSSKNWTINGLLLPPIQLKFVIPVSGHQIVFYLGLNASVTIDWGDATTTTTSTSQNNFHTYSASGSYNVTVTGATATSVFKFGIGSNLIMSPYLTEINSWGGFSLTSLETMLSRFAGTLTTIPTLPSTVTILDYAFYDVSGTIPDITGWVTTNVTSMLSMFHGSNFNQNISDWNTGNVTNMYGMFIDAKQFNQPIGSWNVSKVTSAAYMFASAKKFNQPVNNWRFAPNCNFTGMFSSSTLFNQSVVGWDICGNNVNNMFQNAIAFNQNLGALDISKVTSLSGFFNGTVMSEANINSTLQGWAAQTVRSNVTLDASGLFYSIAGEAGYNTLKAAPNNWTINGLTIAPIRLTFNFPSSGTYSLFTIGNNSTITVDFGNSTSITYTAGMNNITQTYAAGSFNMTITAATTSAIYRLSSFNSGGSPMSPYLTAINSWGGFNITNLIGLFNGYSGTLTAIPSLPSSVTIMTLMFAGLTGTIPDITGWDTSNVVKMIQTFSNSTFNQPIGSWNMTKVNEAYYMFDRASQFNQPLNNWRFAANCNLQQMFGTATAFNQSIVGWNVTGANIARMFQGATSFNQNLGALDISGITDLSNLFDGTAMSTESISNTLYGWSLQSVQSGRSLNLTPLGTNAQLNYYGKIGYNTLTSSRGWTISGTTTDSPMKLQFVTPTSNCSTAVYLGINSSVTINWGDSSSNTITVSGPVTHVYSASGTYSATITGANANAIFQFGDPSLVTKSPYLKSIDTWGIYNLTSIAGAFNGINSTLTFAGKPPLTVTSMQNLFYDASNISLDLSQWTPSGVTNMSGLLQNSKNCNPLISTWTTQSVTNLQNAFLNATGFNQNLGAWNVGNVTNMTGLFSYSGISTANFGSTLLGWSSQTVQPNVVLQAYGETLDSSGQTGYNILTASPKNWKIFTISPIELTIVTPVSNSSTTIYLGVSGSVSISWGDGSSNTFSTSQAVSHLYSASGTYSATIVGQTTNSIAQFGDSTLATSATFLTQITSWGLYNITSLAGAFNGINGTLTSVAAIPATVTNLASLFSGASNLSLNLGAWDVSGVTNMSGLLKNTTNCNPTISAWNTKSVTTLQDAFLNAAAFNQNLGSWNVGNVTNMLGLFSYSGISTANFGSTLLGWSSQEVQPNLTLEAYGEPLDASGQNGYSVLTASPKNWTIKTVAPIQLTITTPSSNNTTTIYLGLNTAVTINWGDGSSNVLSSTGSVSHQYSSASAYSVSINGIQASDIYQFGDSTLATSVAYLTQVNSWGGFTLTSLAGAFNGINGSILTSVATIPSTVTNLSSLFSGASNVSLNLGTWDVSGVTNMSGLLQNSTGSNPTISAWNTKSVTTLQNAFSNAAAFNQSLSSWNVTNVSNMRGVLSYSGISTANFGTTLLGWSSQAVRSNIIMDAYGETLDSNGQTGFNVLTSSPKNWSIFVRGPMELTITTPSTNLYTVIYLGVSGAVNINWGDNSLSAISTSGTISHQYAAEGTYTVFISGNDATSITQFGDSSLTTSVSYLTRVDSWGEFNITSLSGAFNSINGTLTSVAAIPATVTNLASLFSGASNISPNLSAWDVSGVTNMSSLLKNSTGCNPAISAWNTKSVTTLQNAFLNATGFNQSLASWNVGNVTNMLGAFSYSGVNGTNFSAALYAWSLQTVQSNVVMDASGMYYNQRGIQGYNVLTAPLKSWVINGVTLEPMQLTFTIPRANVSSTMYLGVSGSVTVNWGDGSSNVVSSNGPISYAYSSAGTYNVTISGSSVNSLYQFGDPTLTYKSIYLTRVDSYGAFNLTSLAGAFSSTTNLSYLPPLPATVTNTSNMFSYASYVTADISAWDVSGVTDMSEMFSCAIGQSGCFNPDIALWNPQNVTNMQKMFYGNNAFNRAIGGWSTSNVTNMSGMFQGASAFNQPLNNWTTTSVTNMSNMFKDASSFNQPLNNWTTTSVTNMSNMFNGASAFNQTLGSWNVSNVTNMTNMLNYTALSSANFSDLLQGWSTQTMQSGVSLGAAGLVYDASGAQALQTLQTNSGWIVSVAAPSAAMTLVYVITSSATVTFNLAVNPGSTATVNWGDKLKTKYNITTSGTTSFVYSRAGTYTVTITGNLAGFGIVPGGTLNALSGADKLTTISSFGNIGLTYCNFVGASNLTSVPNRLPSTITNMYAMFYNCSKLNDANISNWNTANVTNMSYTFHGAIIFNMPLDDWNVSNVTTMALLFKGATVFNQPIGSWNTSKVTNMERILSEASAFNQPIESWNTSNVTTMYGVFYGASAFNKPIGNWDTSKVTTMELMFIYASVFNQPIDNWNVSNVTNISYLFRAATAFNQSLNSWNTSNVTNMQSTFEGATAFNGNISNWNTANVTTMEGTFRSTNAFNQPLNSWNTSNVTNMYFTFYAATAFNQPLDAWNVSKVITMEHMFNSAILFNQPLNSWNTASLTNMAATFANNSFNQPLNNWITTNVTNMSNLFVNNAQFNQYLGDWNVANVTSMDYTLYNTTKMSMENFSNTLVSWALQPVKALTLSANGLVYNLAGYNASVTLRSRNFNVAGASLQPMTLTLSIPSAGTSTGVFLGMSGSVTVDWGNNSSNTVVGTGGTTAILNTYDSSGPYTVTVSAATPTSIYQFGDPGLTNKSTFLTSIDYGPYYLTSLAGAFNNTNFRLTSVPPLPSTVTNINNIFADASSSLTLDISAWDVSGVTNMRGAFQCTAGQPAGYNPNIVNWNTKNATNTELMFANNKSFNRAIGSWNVAKVTNMSDMFVGASAFNQPINSWNTAAVTLMTRMFSGATSFNQSLNNWSIAGLVSAAAMGNMLDNCAMSTANFNDFLVNLNSYSKTGITLGAAGRVFNGTAAIQSFANLRASKSWTINGATSVSSLSQYSGYQFTFVYYNYSGLPAANKVYTLRDGSDSIATFNAGATVPNTTAYSFTTTLFSGGNHTLSIVDPSGVVVLSSAIVNVSFICFKEDTKILCLKYDREEYVPIQKLKRGDMVKTRLSGYVPIDMIGKTRIYNEGVQERIKDQLYVCKKSKYPEVFEDLYITGAHSILVDKLTETQKRKSLELFDQVCMTEGKYRLMACIDERAAPYEKAGEYNIYHIALANDDPYSNYGVYANGLLVESCSKRFLLDLSNMVILK